MSTPLIEPVPLDQLLLEAVALDGLVAAGLPVRTLRRRFDVRLNQAAWREAAPAMMRAGQRHRACVDAGLVSTPPVVPGGLLLAIACGNL